MANIAAQPSMPTKSLSLKLNFKEFFWSYFAGIGPLTPHPIPYMVNNVLHTSKIMNTNSKHSKQLTITNLSTDTAQWHTCQVL